MSELNHEQLEKYERQIFDLRQLIEISKGLNSTLEYNMLIESILLTCMGQMQLIKAGIFLKKGIDEDAYILHRNYKGFDIDHDTDYEILGASPIIDLFENHDRCWTLEEIKVEVDDRLSCLECLKKINPSLVVPLKSRGKMNGIIILGERINQLDFCEEEKLYLLDIASLAGIAIENAYLYELATTDMMTKLKIHHFFQRLLIEEREKAKKRKKPLILMMLDIDHFKDFNDKYGHLCGDLVLKNVANVIKNNCRQIDIAARYGGEEMAIILPKTDIEAGIIAAERLRRGIEHAVVEHEGKRLSVKVSIGLTQLREEDVTNDDIIGRADRALYMSKENGRNMVSYIL
ncbi:MAG: sensor domain-containing diguanylate cyclase [Spirochaetes bacterium]|nr:sensor domain-containing diguanylate cyclase [Spirochaetota bacterium]MBN2770965.1 sensor domain-containing diguanylate cyclase [Spirochaetota bacterium]